MKGPTGAVISPSSSVAGRWCFWGCSAFALALPLPCCMPSAPWSFRWNKPLAGAEATCRHRSRFCSPAWRFPRNWWGRSIVATACAGWRLCRSCCRSSATSPLPAFRARLAGCTWRFSACRLSVQALLRLPGRNWSTSGSSAIGAWRWR
ncbi:hypothetical protein D3C81_1595600 [compost metagenome]